MFTLSLAPLPLPLVIISGLIPASNKKASIKRMIIFFSGLLFLLRNINLNTGTETNTKNSIKRVEKKTKMKNQRVASEKHSKKQKL